MRRFETPPGHQAQVDWGHLGTMEINGEERKLWGFAFTLGYSRTMMAEAALDQKLGTLLRMHEEGFRQLGGVPQEILYDRMKTVWLETDERGETVWNPVFLDFARYWASRRGDAGRIGPRLKAKWIPESSTSVGTSCADYKGASRVA